MTVWADTAHKQVDTSVRLDLCLVFVALFHEVGCVAVQDIDILLRDVNVTEEIAPHKGIVALVVILGETYIFVHIESDDVLEGHLANRAEVDEFLVSSKGSGAGRQAQYKRALFGGAKLVDGISNVRCCPLRHLAIGIFDDKSHNIVFLILLVRFFK